MNADVRQLIGPLLAFNPVAVYHFGSSAPGGRPARAGSDIDLAFFAPEPCPPYAVFMAGQEIARAAGRDVDLIDLRRCGDVIAAQVVGAGRRIYTADPLRADEFEMLALARYARLNEERHEILVREGVAP